MLSDPEKATVAEVLDGEMLKLSDGRIVRLIAAKAPAPPLASRRRIKAGTRQVRVKQTGRTEIWRAPQ